MTSRKVKLPQDVSRGRGWGISPDIRPKISPDQRGKSQESEWKKGSEGAGESTTRKILVLHVVVLDLIFGASYDPLSTAKGQS